ncbi:DUF6894 family protein [Methylobacterium gnaphalii]|uniref:DUF6894 domain-containing protein n=1 Tax=Methylobacterium gnaphalii TaxID=1010610 RepID=A0A512JIY7_9HYPH|nr:hypothetical protein [Methylobacterium gnaphalii]GEP09925.1 hypothetical protein MGN01_17700 [Methylobacterium gnaphalii]GJD68299.1 hypothetical protein MMMDOFMJ_1218 [Methylobacterium gnaphalii]GLS51781.1 hypothetical protein GCM10007885_46420 [Methylobacterium gnaphalii]
MPRYFIDLHDGANFVKDRVGFDVPDADAVRARLLGVVSRYARDMSADEDRQDLFVIVRDEADRILLRAHLSLDFESLETA